jgi:hypothetical protein
VSTACIIGKVACNHQVIDASLLRLYLTSLARSITSHNPRLMRGRISSLGWTLQLMLNLAYLSPWFYPHLTSFAGKACLPTRAYVSLLAGSGQACSVQLRPDFAKPRQQLPATRGSVLSPDRTLVISSHESLACSDRGRCPCQQYSLVLYLGSPHTRSGLHLILCWIRRVKAFDRFGESPGEVFAASISITTI